MAEAQAPPGWEGEADPSGGAPQKSQVNHLIIDEQPTHVAVANKMLYASHYFWTALELRVLVPDTARGGFWFVSVNRSRSDGLTGFTGSLIRGKVRDEAEKGMEAALAITRSRMERP